jgi:hypothetical protein
MGLFVICICIFVFTFCNVNHTFRADNVIGASPEVLAEVRNPSAMRIYAVDLVKAIIAADTFNGASLQAMLDLHPAWSEFKEQSHDLFITV